MGECPVRVPQPLDAILSTATFHWIADHQALFEQLRGVLLPGGRLVRARLGGTDCRQWDTLRGPEADSERPVSWADGTSLRLAPLRGLVAEGSEHFRRADEKGAAPRSRLP